MPVSGVSFRVRPFSQNPQDAPSSPDEGLAHLAKEPCPQRTGEPRESGVAVTSDPSDAALDALLERASPTVLTTGFAERVIQAVQPEAITMAPRSALRPLRAVGLAAALAVCGGLAWWTVSSPSIRLTLTPGRVATAPTEEEVLLKALANLENSSGDLALVAQLGEVLEAELTGRTSWLEKE